MAFEPVYELARADWNRKLCSGQAVVEARLLPREGEIARVLSTSCECKVNVTEVFAGEARYSGRVNFKVLYLDASGNNHALDYNADFTDKINDNTIVSGMKADVSGKILDTDVVSVSENEIKLAAVVEVDLNVIFSESFKYLMSGGENVYTNDDKIDYCILNAEANKTFTITDHMNDVKINKILMSESKVILLKRTAGIDCITVEGLAICCICGESEDGLIASYRFESPFTEEIAALGAHADNVVVGGAKLMDCKVNFECAEGSNSINVEYTVCVKASVYGDAAIHPVVDAFTIRNELLQSGSSIDIVRNKKCEIITDRVEGSVTLDINMPIVDNVLAATAAKMNITNAYANSGKVTVEGIVSAGIIYYCAENSTKNSVSVEIPFSLTLNSTCAENDIITAVGEVNNIAVKIRRGNELDIKADVVLEICCCASDTKYIITELKLGEELPMPEGAVSIHIAKSKETLWEVAKALSTTPEIVLLQNPTLTLPLSGGERILAYRHITK